jgi:hypothetical protein
MPAFMIVLNACFVDCSHETSAMGITFFLHANFTHAKRNFLSMFDLLGDERFDQAVRACQLALEHDWLGRTGGGKSTSAFTADPVSPATRSR